MKNFSLKFIDIIVGMVLGLGFQWWVNLNEVWQYIAFVFVYLDIIDYWIDYSPSLKKWPPKREIDVLLDVAIMFSLFLYIYSTQLTVTYLLISFMMLRVLDFFWLLSSKVEYNPIHTDKLFIDTWLVFNVLEASFAALFVLLDRLLHPLPITILFIFISFRVITRILASFRYKKVHFV